MTSHPSEVIEVRCRGRQGPPHRFPLNLAQFDEKVIGLIMPCPHREPVTEVECKGIVQVKLTGGHTPWKAEK